MVKSAGDKGVTARTAAAGASSAPSGRAAPSKDPGQSEKERAGLDGGRRTPVWVLAVVTVGLVITSLNLRPAITSLGALLAEVRSGLGMSATVAGLLTSVPSVCFALFGVAAPRLARRFGLAPVLGAGMLAIAVGVAGRSAVGSTAVFLALSGLALAGIALSNVLLPVVVKRWFPHREGAMTGLYSMIIALGTAVPAALTVPLTSAVGGSWRLGLGLWAVPAVLAVLPWIAVALRSGGQTSQERPAGRGVPRDRIVRSPTAWALMVFFGLQSTGAYIVMGWMPQMYRDAGLPAPTAGTLLAVTMGLSVPLSFAIPVAAGKLRNQGPIAVALGVCGIAGYAGLALAPAAAPWTWAVLIGFANGAFPLALTMIAMRSRTGTGVVRLSAFTQSAGYLTSIPGPILIGALYQHTGGWHLPIALMTALLIPQIITGVLAGRARYVEDEIHPAPGPGGGRRGGAET